MLLAKEHTLQAADLDLGSEVNLYLSPLKSPTRTTHSPVLMPAVPEGMQGFQKAAIQISGEGLGFYYYNKVTDKNIKFSLGKIITVISKVAYCNNINSGDNNSNNMIII